MEIENIVNPDVNIVECNPHYTTQSIINGTG